LTLSTPPVSTDEQPTVLSQCSPRIPQKACPISANIGRVKNTGEMVCSVGVGTRLSTFLVFTSTTTIATLETINFEIRCGVRISRPRSAEVPYRSQLAPSGSAQLAGGRHSESRNATREGFA